MDNKLPRVAEGFIVNLTGANAEEVKEYIAEFRLNQEFQNSIEEKQSVFGKRRHSSYDFSIGTTYTSL